MAQQHVSFSNEEIKGMFDKMDINKDGVLTREELQQGVIELGIRFDEPSFLAATGRGGLNLSDTTHHVSYKEFETFVRHRERELNHLFEMMDKNHDGHLTAEEVQETLKHFGLAHKKQVVNKLMEALDRDHSGDITADEWKKMVLLAPTEEIEGLLSDWEDVVTMGSTATPVAPIQHGKTLKQVAQHLLSGMIAGSAAKTAVAPLSRLKVLFQISTEKQPPSFFGTLQKIYTESGIKGFYRGNLGNCLKSGPELGVKLMAFDSLKERFTDADGNLSAANRFLAGGFAAIISHAIMFPMAVIHTRLEATHAASGYHGVIGTAMTIYRNEGFIPTFYRGFVPMIISTFPANGISLGFYSFLKTRLETQRGQDLGAGMLAACSTTAGIVSEGVTYPMHLVKTRLMTQGAPGIPRRYSGVIDCFRQIYTTEGAAGLYKGFTPALIKHVPSVAVTMVSYEILKKQFGLEKAHHGKH